MLIPFSIQPAPPPLQDFVSLAPAHSNFLASLEVEKGAVLSISIFTRCNCFPDFLFSFILLLLIVCFRKVSILRVVPKNAPPLIKLQLSQTPSQQNEGQ